MKKAYRVTIDYTHADGLTVIHLDTVTAVRLLVDASLNVADLITIEVV